ncbi:MAG: hypothetical protein P8Y27_00925 [Chromatiaceae bacterium]|jgi:hypothetical protein
MNSTQSETAGNRQGSDLYATDAGAFIRLCRVVESYANGKHVRTHAYLHASIRRLSVFANDESISVHTPERVAKALCIYGQLLCSRQRGALEGWLEKRPGSDRQAAA